MGKLRLYVAAASILALLAAGVCMAAERPGTEVEKPKAEHPGKEVEKIKAEHPGKPVTAKFVKKPITGAVTLASFTVCSLLGTIKGEPAR